VLRISSVLHMDSSGTFGFGAKNREFLPMLLSPPLTCFTALATPEQRASCLTMQNDQQPMNAEEDTLTGVIENVASNHEPDGPIIDGLVFHGGLVCYDCGWYCNLSYLVVTRNLLLVKYHVPHVDAVIVLLENSPLLIFDRSQT
jgi:hypothetical protein